MRRWRRCPACLNEVQGSDHKGFATIAGAGIARGTAVDLPLVMIQTPADIGRRILELARIAVAIHEQDGRTELAVESAPQDEQVNGALE